MNYIWDHDKRLSNVAKHGLDLARGIELFDGRPVLTFPSPRGEEARMVTVANLDGRMVALVWLRRGAEIRLISLRRARNAETGQFSRSIG